MIPCGCACCRAWLAQAVAQCRVAATLAAGDIVGAKAISDTLDPAISRAVDAALAEQVPELQEHAGRFARALVFASTDDGEEHEH